MTSQENLTITLNEKEAIALRKVIENLNDKQFKELCNVQSMEREYVRDLWVILNRFVPLYPKTKYEI